MSRLTRAFQDGPIFMPYFPLGFPELGTSIDVIEALAQNGADVIEVGLAFSDPLADGPVIQKATQIALRNGLTVHSSLLALRELRRRGVTVPLLLMGYYNPLLAYGVQRFAQEAEHEGADGFIIPDLPMEEAGEFEPLIGELPLIRMLAPTTPEDRMEAIARSAKGFIYLVSVTGTTGVRSALTVGLGDLIQRVRAHTNAPVCVGFGIGTPKQAREVASIADGVIVGSALVRAVGESSEPTGTARSFAASFSEALKMKV